MIELLRGRKGDTFVTGDRVWGKVHQTGIKSVRRRANTFGPIFEHQHMRTENGEKKTFSCSFKLAFFLP